MRLGGDTVDESKTIAARIGQDVAACAARARARLLAERNAAGHWTGELSSSALSTATAVVALTLAHRQGHEGTADLIARGRLWLANHQNTDGGWGDTTDSPSNISTTTLCWAALGMEETEGENGDSPALRLGQSLAAAWLEREVGTLDQASIAKTICERYGVDRTFSVPILTLCTLAGRFGDTPDAWRRIPTLPFELGALPRNWFSRLGLPVVSYALPALIAIGQVQHRRNPSRNPLLRGLRTLAQGRTLRILSEIQPDSGGFLEAAPLTSFVALSLIGAGLAHHSVTQRCLAFLTSTVRADGSWPIDTNLCLWGTTLAIKALAAGSLEDALGESERADLLRWLLTQQGKSVHRYTLAAPGGWAWTDLSGGVPDGDDTPGALLALHHLAPKDSGGRIATPEALASAEAGIEWLLGLQNRDGGIPTFCRGWGKLPFDKSCPDLTAHALRAWFAWRGEIAEPLRARMDHAAARALRFLMDTQERGGYWIPLWFGNQEAPEQHNPVYGTALVLAVPALPQARDYDGLRLAWERARERALDWMRHAQLDNGGWGGAPGVPPSIEETALAVDAIARCMNDGNAPEVSDALWRGCAWLVAATEGGTKFPASPIGLYFAKLWYHERLYPIVFTISALSRAQRHLAVLESA